MNEILIGPGNVFTRNPENPQIVNGGVYIKNGVIADVGRMSALEIKYPDAERVDVHGGVIMPGLTDLHHHSYLTLLRGFARPFALQDLEDVEQEFLWKFDRAMSLEDVRMGGLCSFADCVRSGVTTVFDHHASYGAVTGSLFALSEAAEQIGLRTCLFFEVSDRGKKEKMQEAVRENALYMDEVKDSAMRRGMMGLHASSTLSEETLMYAAAFTPEQSGFHIHLSKTMADVFAGLDRYGKRPTERLYDLNILGRQTLCADAVHITPGEMDILSGTDAPVIYNPQSAMADAVGCAPLIHMLERGVKAGIGTDGAGDLLEAFRTGLLLQKHHLCDLRAGEAELPYMMFCANPEIAGRFFPDVLGKLCPGAAGDVIALDYFPATPMDPANLDAHILAGMQGGRVTTTVCNGRVLMREGVLQTVDEEEIRVKTRERVKALWERLG